MGYNIFGLGLLVDFFEVFFVDVYNDYGICGFCGVVLMEYGVCDLVV